MDTVKDIAAVIGVIISAASLLALVSKSFRGVMARLFKKYGKTDEVAESVAKIEEMLTQHIEDEKEFKASVEATNSITLEFARTQCRNIIKLIFYKYNDTKILPLYEKKTLMSIEDLYINKLHANSFASLLLNEMSTWKVDYSSAQPGEEDT